MISFLLFITFTFYQLLFYHTLHHIQLMCRLYELLGRQADVEILSFSDAARVSNCLKLTVAIKILVISQACQ